MSLKDLKIEADIEETNLDTLPGRDFTVPTNLYDMLITGAYTLKSPAGAEGLHFTLKPADGSPQEVRESFYMTSGTAKGGKQYYINSNGKKQYLKGFAQATQLAKIACDKAVADLQEEEKVLKLWNSANQAEENTKVNWLPELVGKPIKVGILHVHDNRLKKEGNKWVKLPTERFYNEVDKLFYPSGHAVTEKLAGKDATFQERWAKLYPAGETVDRYEQVEGSEPDVPENETDQLTEEGITSLFGTDS